jgi:phosphoribosylglycinamide formyltransferase-1
MRKVAIFGSGDGSNFEAIVKYFENKSHEIEFVCISDVEKSDILSKAEKTGILNCYVPVEETETFLSETRFDLIVLSGYNVELSPETFKMGVFINLQSSLSPDYRGIDAVKQAFDSGAKITGITIHIVSGKIDEGSVIAQQAISINQGETLVEIEKKVQKTKNYLYPQVIEDILFSLQSGCSSNCSSDSSCGCSSKGCGSSGCSGCKH